MAGLCHSTHSPLDKPPYRGVHYNTRSVTHHRQAPDLHPIGRGKTLRIRQSLAYACAAVALLIASVSPSIAGIYCDFESGLGRNGQAIRTDINGLSFSTTTGGDIYYADINTGNYSVTSDNGKAYEGGDYFMSGDVAAYVANVPDIGRISFQYGSASYLTLGYCAGFPLTLEAYDVQGTLLGSAFGSVNTKTSGGLAMGFLTVTGQSMSYVLLRGTGGYWLIDNISTDAPVPEPSSILAIGCGLAGLLAGRLRVKKHHQLLLALFAFILAANTVIAGPLTRLYVKPGHMAMRPGMQQQFQAYGLDIFDNDVPVTEPLTWSTDPSAGTITQSGLFTAGTTTGVHIQGVTVTTPSGLTGTALVTIIGSAVDSGYMLERSWGKMNPGYLATPTLLAVDSNDCVYVEDDAMTKFDSSGRYIVQFGPLFSERLDERRAQGVAFYGGYAYVAHGLYVAKCDSSGRILNQWGSTSYGTDGYWQWIGDIGIDNSGNVYLIDPDRGRVLKYTISGTFVKGWGSSGSGTGQLKRPHGLCVDPQGNVYIADTENDRIVKFDTNGNLLATWSNFGGTYGLLHYPEDVTIGPDGNLYIASWSTSHRVLKINSTGSALASWTLASKYYPRGIAVDSTGCMYTTSLESSTKGVSKWDLNGNKIAAWSKTSPEGNINGVSSLAVGPDGTVYIARDFVHKFDGSGNFLGRWAIDGTWLYRITTDQYGYVYTNDYYGAGKYTPSGQILRHWVMPTGTKTSYPFGVAVAQSGDVYISDDNNNRICRFDANGTFISQWGSTGSGNGQFDWVHDIAVDAAGNVYAADSNNYRIQKFDFSGTYLAQWASINGTQSWGMGVGPAGDIFSGEMGGACRYSSDGVRVATWGGPYGTFRLQSPIDIAADARGSVYVADSYAGICKFAALQPTCGPAKQSADAAFAAVSGLVVSASSAEMGDCFYMQSKDASSGIRVIGGTANRGAKVIVAGTLTTVDGERAIKATSVTSNGTDTISPVALTNKSLGGADLNYDPATGAGQMGVEDGQGANNIGLLVKTTGRVTGMGSDFVYIDDGTHARDGSIFVGVRVLTSKLTKPAVGSQVTVTGISRINKIGDRYFRCIAARIQGDIVVAP